MSQSLAGGAKMNLPNPSRSRLLAVVMDHDGLTLVRPIGRAIMSAPPDGTAGRAGGSRYAAAVTSAAS